MVHDMDTSSQIDVKALAAEMRNFARDVLSQDVESRDQRGATDFADWQHLWQAMAHKGLLGLALPVQYGGRGLDVLSSIRVLQELGYGCHDNGLLLGLNGQMWAMQMSILEFGSEDQKAQYLPKLVSGETICAHGVTEVASGSNAMSMQTRAEKVDGGYRITGEKIWIGMGPVADLAQVFAVTNPDHGAWGLSTFLVDMATPGISFGEQHSKMGHRTVPAGQINFEGVLVPDAALLGPEGAGQSIFNRSIDWERRFIFSAHVGAMRRQVDECILFARERAPGGTPIDTHQSVSNRLADMRVRYETSRLMLENAAREMDEGAENKVTAPAVKLHISEAMLENAMDAMRIKGGAGYKTGETERMLRDAVGAITLGGTSDIQRKIIASIQRVEGLK